ncbi:MAG: PQQ-binding-like beta-propeller repeat protein, partial [Bacillota bacterium]|nr:PQQ-binding-like beta-propeller repeat protein [Bacillota bacterium]
MAAFADDGAEHLVRGQEGTLVEYSTDVSQGKNSFSNVTTSPVMLNGNIYTVSGTKLVKVDPTNGKILVTSRETVPNRYSYYITISENKILVQCGGTIKAFDESLNCLWTSKGVPGEQGLSRILYSGGYVYGATVSPTKNNTPAYMYCVDSSNGKLCWRHKFESDGFGGEYGAWRGSYWGGIVAAGDYIVFLGEGGRAYSFRAGEKTDLQINCHEVTEPSDEDLDELDSIDSNGQNEEEPESLYEGVEEDDENLSTEEESSEDDLEAAEKNVDDPYDIEPVDKLDLGEELSGGRNYSCRSGAVYSEGKIYFTANDYASSGYPGSLFSVGFNEKDGTFGNLDSKSLGNTSVATPAIYGNRIYAATNGTIVVLNKVDLSQFYKIVANKTKIYDVALTEVDGQIYGYATYYDKPGGIIVFRDKEGQARANSFDLGNRIPKESSQYCASQALIGSDGGVYFTNDSGRLMKLLQHNLKHVKNSAGYLKNGSEYDKCMECGQQFNVKKIAGYGSPGLKSFKVSKGSKCVTARWSKLSKSNQMKTSG